MSVNIQTGNVVKIQSGNRVLISAPGPQGPAGTGGTPGGTNTQVQFNDSSAFGGDAGLTYNKSTDTLSATNLTVSGVSTLNHIHGSIAGNLYVHVKNTTAGTLAKGTPVYATDSVGASGEIEVAAADYTNSAKMPAIGILDAELGVNAEGNAVVVGEVMGLATNSYAINQELFVGTNGLLGALPATGQAQSIAVVSRAHASTGIIVVNAQARLNAALTALANNDGASLTGITAAQVGAIANGDSPTFGGITLSDGTIASGANALDYTHVGNQGDIPYFRVNLNDGTDDIGQTLLGFRGDGAGSGTSFIQGSSTTLRVEQSGGSLADIQAANVSGTNTGDITLAGTPDYLTLTNQVLTRNAIDLAADVTGTLGIGNGGTGATTLTANNVLLGNGTSALQVVAPGTTGNVLTSNGTTWTSAAPATTNPAGSGSELQFRSSGTAFGAVTGSSVSGGAVTLASPLTVAQGTLTDPATAVSVTATWNDIADTFIGVDTNITNTNSAAASRLERWRVGGTELAAVTRLGGLLATSNGNTTPAYGSASNTDFGIYFESSRLMVREATTPIAGFGDSAASTIGLIMGGTRPIGWSATTPDGTYAAQLGYAAAATVQMGANTSVNSATAVAQTLKGPNATGTTSTGGSLTIAGGTGTTAGGAVILATSASTGAPVAAVTVSNNAVTTFAKPPVMPVYTVATLPATAAAGMVQGAHAVVTDATTPTYLGALTGGGAIVCPVFYNGTAWVSH